MTVAAPQVSIADVQAAHQELTSVERTRASGNLDKALEDCQALLERHPDYFGALSMLGKIHMQKDAYGAALPHLVRAVMKNPRNWECLTNLGKTHFELGAADHAVRCLEKADALSPGHPVTLFVLAEARGRQEDYERAAGALGHALADAPDDARLAVWLGTCLVKTNEIDAAAEAFAKAAGLSLSPYEKASVLYSLCELPFLPAGFDLLSAVENLAEVVPDGRDPARPFLDFAMAKALHGAARYEEAWACWTNINARIAEDLEEQRQTYLVQGEELVGKALNWKPQEARKSIAKDAKTPISLFLLGPSRSGKTSLESLVVQLEGVVAGYENDIVKNTARRVTQRAGLLTEDFLASVPDDCKDAVSDAYRDQLNAAAGDASVFTVTHPGAIADAGVLAECVPNARFVFLRRDEDDTAFRIFTNLYKANANQFAYNLDDIYEYLSQYRRMIDNWLEKLGAAAVSISYEEMVSDPAVSLGRVAGLCGLDVPPKPDLHVPDDRDCAAPYREWMRAARSR